MPLAACLLVAFALAAAPTQDAAADPTALVPTRWLVASGGPEAAREILRARLRGPGAWRPRGAGRLTDAPFTWQPADDPAVLRGIAAAWTRVEVEEAQVRMARLSGGATLLVNGEPFQGDPEHRGHRGVPVALRAGANELIVLDAPLGFEFELWRPETTTVIGDWAADVPAVTRSLDTWSWRGFSAPVFNASTEWLEGLHFHYGHAVPDEPGATPGTGEWADSSEPVAPLGMRECEATFNPEDDCDPRTAADVALVSVHTYSEKEEPCRALLRVPLLDELLVPRARPRPDSARGYFSRASRLIVGTRGTPEETAAHLAHARFDQQRVWYRSGYTPAIVTDERYVALVDGEFDRRTGELGVRRAIGDVVLYGNADTNAAWERVLGDEPPLEARRCRARVGERELYGDGHFGRLSLPQAASGGRWRSLVLQWNTGTAGARAAAAPAPGSPRDG